MLVMKRDFPQIISYESFRFTLLQALDSDLFQIDANQVRLAGASGGTRVLYMGWPLLFWGVHTHTHWK